MPADAASSSRRKTIVAASLVALPVIPFVAILSHFAINVPLMDDYDGGLDYLNHLTQMHGFWAKFVYCMTAQHNEYKTVFANTVVWMQTAIFGHIDFRLTCFLGDLFVPLIGIVLWKMFLPERKDVAARLVLFSPVMFILFQLNYVQTLNWALPALQNLAVVAFVLAAIYFFAQDTVGCYYSGLAAMVLGISASTNGFLVVPIAILLLFNRRRFMRIGGLIMVATLCLGVYLFRYTYLPSLGPEHSPLLATVLFRRPVFLLSFLGSAAFLPEQASPGLGIVIVLYLSYMFRRGYWRKNPAVSCCVLFILLTALGVTKIRSQFGLWEGTDSRYRIYCDLLIIFAWFSFVEEFLQYRTERLRDNRQFKAAFVTSLLFCLLMDVGGIYSLHKRNRLLVRGIVLYEHPQPGQPAGPVISGPNERPDNPFYPHARVIMDETMKTGVYYLPRY